MQSNTVVNIRLPKNNHYNDTNKNCYGIQSNYELQPIRDCFDPNISTSPPNNFIELLKKRINTYYSKDE